MTSISSEVSSSSDYRDFQTAVMLEMNPDRPAQINLRAQGKRYLEQIKSSPEGWKIILERMQTNASSNGPVEVLFFCLMILTSTVLSRYDSSSFSSNDRTHLCRSVMVFVRDILPLHPQPYPIQGKLATLIVFIFQRDYPIRWPSFFVDFVGLLNTGGINVIELFLRILLAIDVEVVTHDTARTREEVDRNMKIKDAMRGGTDMRLIIDTIYTLLLRSSTAQPSSLAVQCLNTLKEYIGWIDINLVANERFVGLFYSFLGSKNEDLKEGSTMCLLELVKKKMEPMKKVELIQQFRILDLLLTVNPAEVDQSIQLNLATLIQRVGLQLVSICSSMNEGGAATLAFATELSPTPTNQSSSSTSTSSQTQLLSLIDQTLLLSYRFFAVCDWSILCDSELPDLLISAAKLMNSHSNLFSQTHPTHARQMYQSISKAMQFPNDYNFDKPDDQEEKFQSFRTSLKTLFFVLVPELPDDIQDLVCQQLALTLTQWKSQSWSSVECSLRLIFDFREALRLAFEARLAVDPLRSMIQALFSSDISTHNHPQVVLLYLEIIYRYSKFLDSHPQFIAPLLQIFLDQRGIHHTNKKVRDRACYLLYRLLIGISDSLKKYIRPYVDQMLSQLQAVVERQLNESNNGASNRTNINNQSGFISYESSNYLCESMGLLISSAVTGDNCPTYVKTLLSFFSPRFDQCIQTINAKKSLNLDNKNSLSDELYDNIGDYASVLLDAFGNVTKSLKKDSNKIGPLLLEIFPSIMSLFLLFPSHESVRAKTIFVIHRMVESTGEMFIGFIPLLLDPLINFAQSHNIHLFLALLNQIILTYKNQVFNILDTRFAPICAKVFSCLQGFVHLDPDSNVNNYIGSISDSVSINDNSSSLRPLSLSHSISNGSPSIHSPSLKPIAAYSTDRQDRASIQKLYLSFLRLLLNHLPNVFISPINLPHVHALLDTISKGLDSGESSNDKSAFAFMSDFLRYLHIQGLLMNTDNIGNLLRLFFYKEFTSKLYLVLFDESFNLSDPNVLAAFKELITLQREMCRLLENDYINTLGEYLVSTLGWPTEIVQEYIILLQKGDLEIIKRFIQTLRSSRLGINIDNGNLNSNSRRTSIRQSVNIPTPMINTTLILSPPPTVLPPFPSTSLLSLPSRVNSPSPPLSTLPTVINNHSTPPSPSPHSPSNSSSSSTNSQTHVSNVKSNRFGAGVHDLSSRSSSASNSNHSSQHYSQH